MEIYLALCVLIGIGVLFFFNKAGKPARQWSDGELRQYLDTNGSRRNRLMIDGFKNPTKRREYEALDLKYIEVESEWNRRLTAPKKVDMGDLHWLEARKDFVAKTAKALAVSDQEAGRQIIETRKNIFMRFSGRTSAFDKNTIDELVEKMVRQCYSPKNTEAEKNKRQHNEKIANLKREFVAKGLPEDKALEQSFAAIYSEANEKKKTEERKSAEQGDANAQYAMGTKLLGDNNLDTAMEWINKAADQGHVKAIGKVLEKGFQYPISDERRHALVLSLAKSGDTNCQCTVACTLLQNGNFEQAKYWLDKAAEKGQPHAIYLLAKMLEEGNGFEKNHSKAMEYYLKSANLGYSPSQLHLSVCYETGYGVPQDPKLAYMWCALAARSGKPDDLYRISSLINAMTPNQFEQAKILLANWKGKR